MDDAFKLLLGYFIFLGFMLVGWVANIVTNVMAIESLSGMTGYDILSIVGIVVAPLGVVMGYIGMF